MTERDKTEKDSIDDGEEDTKSLLLKENPVVVVQGCKHKSI